MADLTDRRDELFGGRYRLERELGRGGMAIVYLAEDVRHRRLVAIKVLHPDLSAEVGAERFTREIEIASHLTHPHILPLHDSGEADGLLYYVMPYVEGESLRQRLDREAQLSVDAATRIAREVADALAYAHSRDIVHRDIKPENILLQAGHALVSDFGIARAIGPAAGHRLTSASFAVGTPLYMSPEQAAGERNVDARTDVYSLGCVLYEMLAGLPPFIGATPQAILARKSAEPPPRLRIVRATVPVELEAVIVRALAAVPADRYPTAAEFRDALAAPPSLRGGGVPRGRAPRQRRAIAMAAVLTVAVAGAGWWMSSDIRGAGTDPIRSLAVLPFDNLSGDSAQAYFVAGMHDAIIGQLSQIAALRVISRTSVLRYRNSEKSAAEIARDLNVDGLLEGSVLRAGDSVRIQVQLIRARPREAHMWAQTYDRDMRHVLAMHSDVARAVARAVEVKLTPGEATRFATARVVDGEAYEAYLKGMVHYQRLTAGDLDAAERYFDVALRHDAKYALAYAGHAAVWAARQQMGYTSNTKATPRAREAAQRAVELDSMSGEVHARLAAIATWSDWDWEAGERAFRRAIDLAPHLAQNRAGYGHLLAIRGRVNEATAQLEHAVRLDPLNPMVISFYGSHLVFLGRYDDALAQFRKALTLSPDQPNARQGVFNALHHKGDHAGALAELRSQAADHPDPDPDLERAVTEGYSQGGYREAMLRAAALEAVRNRRPIRAARLYIYGGDKQKALYWLEQAYARHDPNMPYIGTARAWDNLRSEPRFQELLRLMKLPAGGPPAATT